MLKKSQDAETVALLLLSRTLTMDGRSAVERLLDPTNPSVTLQTLERAASAVGKRLKIQLTA